MARPGRGADRALRRRGPAVALDAGATTIRLWTPSDGFVETASPPLGPPACGRNDATARTVDAARDAVRDALPRRVRRRPVGFPVAVAVPAGATVEGRRRLEEAVRSLNRGQPVLLMEAPLAAAVGSDLDVTGRAPYLVVDVGVYGSEAAVVADGRVVDSVAAPVGCADVLRERARRLNGRRDTATPPASAQWRAVGTPTRVDGPVDALVVMVRRAVWRGHERLGTDPLGHGITVVGGGAALPALLARLRLEFGADVTRAHDPRRATIRGLSALAIEADRLPQLWDV
ncbi:MAG TPA: rod shape-determining protein [Mycobacteriales bacterium]|nr:rod shape-determining protein [Mycobacteriales bacterium]